MNSGESAMEEPAAKILKKKGIRFERIQLEKPAFTVDDVVKYSQGRVQRESIVKTMVLRDKAGKFFAVCLRGGDRIDFGKVSRIRESKSKLASPDEVFEVVGLKIGAINPVVLDIPLYIDKRIIKLDKISFASGKHDVEIEAELVEVLKAIEFEEADVVE